MVIADTVVVPTPTGVTKPSTTVATAESLVSQVTALLAAFVGATLAVSCTAALVVVKISWDWSRVTPVTAIAPPDATDGKPCQVGVVKPMQRAL